MACIRKRRGKYVIDYRDGGGTRRWITCRNKREADKAFGQISGQESLVSAVNPNIKVDEYSKRYLDLKSASTKPRTVESYDQNFRLYILPAFGNRKVRKLLRGDIKSFLASKRAGGLSRNTVRIIHSTLRGMLTAAIDDGLISANPASVLGRSLNLVTSANQRQEEIKAMDRGQIKKFLAASEAAKKPFDRNCYPLFLTMAKTGMRIGEAVALEWDDIKFEASTIRIERSFDFKNGQIVKPKPNHGRTVDMNKRLTEVLQYLQAERRKEWFQAGKGKIPNLVFPSKAETILDYANIERAFKRILKAAELPKHFSTHCLRHTYASILISDGVSLAYVQRQLGHKSIKLTVDTYGKWLPIGNKTAVDRLDEDDEKEQGTAEKAAVNNA